MCVPLKFRTKPTCFYIVTVCLFEPVMIGMILNLYSKLLGVVTGHTYNIDSYYDLYLFELVVQFGKYTQILRSTFQHTYNVHFLITVFIILFVN